MTAAAEDLTGRQPAAASGDWVGGGHSPALLPALEAAVPLKIMELRSTSAEQRIRLLEKRDVVDTVAGHGDELLYGGKHCAETFAALALALAVGAYQPGGITFCSLHWCAGSGHMGVVLPWPYTGGPCGEEVQREQTGRAGGQPVQTLVPNRRYL